MKFATALTVASLAIGYTEALSSGCTTALAAQALGNLGQCLQLTSLLPLFQANGSVIDPLNTYLGSLCASSTPTCSNSTLTSAESSLESGCSSDVSAGGSSAQIVQTLMSLVQSYPQVYSAACSKNSTTGAYCLTSTLGSIQNITNQSITTTFITSVTQGSGDADNQLQTALNTGSLCTGCFGTLYNDAITANASIANTTVAKAITSKCGANFGQAAASGASGVSTAAASATSSASSSAAAAASSSKSAGSIVSTINFLPVIMTAVTVVTSLAIGGSLVL